MNKNTSFPRHEILSLSFKDFRESSQRGKRAELAVTEDGVDAKDHDRSTSAWLLSTPYRVPVSRNRIATTLLKYHRNGFSLNDPHLHESRFFVEYHRLQDPALKRYFESGPVRQRLDELGAVTTEDNVLCSTKDFAEYLRYIESIRSMFIRNNIKKTEAKKLCLNLQKVEAAKKYESQFTGIFRRKKYIKSQTDDRKTKERMIEIKKEKYAKISVGIAKAVERAEKIKEEKKEVTKQKNQHKENNVNINKQEIIKKERIRKVEMSNTLISKLENAKERKEYLLKENKIKKLIERLDNFKQHWIFRQEARMKSIKYVEMYENELRLNKEKREQRLKKIHENDAMMKIKLRKELASQQRDKEIVRKVMKQVDKLSKKYIKLVDPNDLEEITRRFSMLTEPFVIECLRMITWMLNDLEIPVSAATILSKLRSVMAQLVIVLPDIGQTKCVLVQKHAACFVSQSITQIMNERLKRIRDNLSSKSAESSNGTGILSGFETSDESEPRQKRVSVNNDVEIIGESSYDEFIGDLKRESSRKSEKIYNLTYIVNMEMKNLFDIIVKIRLEYSEKLNDRDFVHLYEFQKSFLTKAIRRLTELVKVKQYHLWHVNRNVESWRKLNLDQEELSIEAITLIMGYPDKCAEFCECVRKISKLICVQLSDAIDQDAAHENNDDEVFFEENLSDS